MIKRQSSDFLHPAGVRQVIGVGGDPDTRFPSLAAVLVTKRGPGRFSHRLLRVDGMPASSAANAARWWRLFCVKFSEGLRNAAREVGVGNYSLAVESQQVRSGKVKSQPEALIKVAHSTGLILSFAGYLPDESVILDPPLPSQWKGEVPKDTHQARTWLDLGVRCRLAGGKDPYCIPAGAAPMSDHGDARHNLEVVAEALPAFRDSDWKHLGDSIGLAIWAGETTIA